MKLTYKLTGSAIAIIVFSLILTGGIASYLINRNFDYYLQTEHLNTLDHIKSSVSNSVNNPMEDMFLELDMYVRANNYIFEIQDENKNVLYVSSNFVRKGMMNRHLNVSQIQNMPMYNDFAVVSYLVLDEKNESYLLNIAYDKTFMNSENVVKFQQTMYTSILIALVVSACLGAIAFVLLSSPLASSISHASENAKRLTLGKKIIYDNASSGVVELESLHSSILTLDETLRDQEELRRNIVETLSHEVKTPLTVLNSHIDAFIDGVYEPDRVRMEKCKDEIQRIQDLMGRIDDINDLSSKSIILNLEKFDLENEIQAISMILEPQFRKKNINLETSFSGNLEVELDKYKLRQILYNLLSNALKFSDPYSIVKLRVESMEFDIDFYVENTGLVIEPSSISHLFEAKFRAPDADEYDVTGKGLGLKIASNLSQAMGGKVSLVKSDAESTCFRLSINLQ